MAHIGRSKNRYPHHHSLLDPVSRLLQWQHTRLKRLCATSESTDRPQSSLWVGIQYLVLSSKKLCNIWKSTWISEFYTFALFGDVDLW